MDITRLCGAGCLMLILTGCVATPADQPAASSSSVGQIAQIYEAPKTLNFSVATGITESISFLVQHSEGKLTVSAHDSSLNVSLMPISSTQTQVNATLISTIIEQQRTGAISLQLQGLGESYADIDIPVTFDIYRAFSAVAHVSLHTYVNVPAQEYWNSFIQRNRIPVSGARAEWRISCNDERLLFSPSEGNGGGIIDIEFSDGAIFQEDVANVTCRVADAHSGEVIELAIPVLTHEGSVVLDNPINFSLNTNGSSEELIATSQVISVPGTDYPHLFTDWKVSSAPEFVTVTPTEGNTATQTVITVDLDVKHPAFSNYRLHQHALTLSFGRDYADSKDFPIEIMVNTPLIKSKSSLVSFEGVPIQLLFDTHLLEEKSLSQQLEVLVDEQALAATHVNGKYIVELGSLAIGQHELKIKGSEHLQTQAVNIKPPLAITEQVNSVGSQDKLYFDSVQELLALFNEQERRLTTFIVDGQGLTRVDCEVDGEIEDVAQVGGTILALTAKQVYRLHRSEGSCLAQAMVEARYAAKSAYKIPDYQYFYPDGEKLIFAKFPKLGVMQLEPDEAIDNYQITEALYFDGIGQGEINLGFVLFEEMKANNFSSPKVISGNGFYLTNDKNEVQFGRVKYPFSQPMLDIRGGQFDFRGQWFLSAEHQLFKLEDEVYRQKAAFEGVKLSRIAQSGERIYTLILDDGSFSVEIFGYREGELVRLQSKKIESQMVNKDGSALMVLAGDQRTAWVLIAGNLYSLALNQ